MEILTAFAIWGMVCVKDDNEFGRRCFNYWEDPVQKYTTRELCDARAEELGNQIIKEFKENNLIIDEISIWCLPVDNKSKT